VPIRNVTASAVVDGALVDIHAELAIEQVA
jgi:hypothetical protein